MEYGGMDKCRQACAEARLSEMFLHLQMILQWSWFTLPWLLWRVGGIDLTVDGVVRMSIVLSVVLPWCSGRELHMWERITKWGETPSGRKSLRVGKCMSGRKLRSRRKYLSAGVGANSKCGELTKCGGITVSRGIYKSAQNDEKFLVNLWYD